MHWMFVPKQEYYVIVFDDAVYYVENLKLTRFEWVKPLFAVGKIVIATDFVNHTRNS